MIKLENILTEYYFVNYRSEKDRIFLREHGLENYQQLKDFIELDPSMKKTILAEDVKRLEQKLKVANEKGVEGSFYTTNGYLEEDLALTDELVMGSSLLMGNPTSKYGVYPASVGFYTIARLKQLMNYVMPDGTNALIYTLRNFGTGDMNRLLGAINMYEEQVLRQSMETARRDINLFGWNKEVKDDLVRDSLKEIVLYLIYNTEEELVWGKLTDNQKRLLMSAVVNDKKQDVMIRDNLVNVISNYTTLEELEAGIVKGKTLNRFIKR